MPTSLIQTNFFDKIDDIRPLPLIIAERWQFSLDYQDQDGIVTHYLYQARQWYIGLGGDKGRWSKSKNDWLTDSHPVKIEVKRERRKPEWLDYVDAEGLYSIAAHMSAATSRPQLSEVKRYLAKAGVLVDEIRRNPEETIARLNNTAEKRYEKILIAQGFTSEQIPALQTE